MSNGHIFGVTRRRHDDETVARVDAIARRHGCYAVAVRLPGNPTRGWICGPNMGHPFDRDRARAVMSEIDASGVEW